jgi:Spy/CpxP family protein refolding chaperone
MLTGAAKIFLFLFSKELHMVRMRWIGIGCVAMVVAGMAAMCTMAADEPAKPAEQSRGQGMARGGSGLALLRLDAVAKDLELSDEQKESLKKVDDEARTKMKDLRDSLKDASREERMPKLVAAEKEITEKVDSVLNEKQRARLKEIRLQVRGAGALSDPSIADALKLTDEQKQKLMDLAKERRDAVRTAIQDAGGDRTAARAKIGPIVKDANEKMQKVLTPEQTEEFDKMKGKKLDLGDAAIGSLGRRPAESK